MGVDDPVARLLPGLRADEGEDRPDADKTYRQDQALDWGFLTEPEVSHRERKKAARGPDAAPST